MRWNTNLFLTFFLMSPPTIMVWWLIKEKTNKFSNWILICYHYVSDDDRPTICNASFKFLFFFRQNFRFLQHTESNCSVTLDFIVVLIFCMEAPAFGQNFRKKCESTKIVWYKKRDHLGLISHIFVMLIYFVHCEACV